MRCRNRYKIVVVTITIIEGTVASMANMTTLNGKEAASSEVLELCCWIVEAPGLTVSMT
jgi:hypothetical protein